MGQRVIHKTAPDPKDPTTMVATGEIVLVPVPDAPAAEEDPVVALTKLLVEQGVVTRDQVQAVAVLALPDQPA